MDLLEITPKNKNPAVTFTGPDGRAATFDHCFKCLRHVFCIYSPYRMTVAKVQGGHDLSEELPGFFGC